MSIKLKTCGSACKCKNLHEPFECHYELYWIFSCVSWIVGKYWRCVFHALSNVYCNTTKLENGRPVLKMGHCMRLGCLGCYELNILLPMLTSTKIGCCHKYKTKTTRRLRLRVVPKVVTLFLLFACMCAYVRQHRSLRLPTVRGIIATHTIICRFIERQLFVNYFHLGYPMSFQKLLLNWNWSTSIIPETVQWNCWLGWNCANTTSSNTMLWNQRHLLHN